MKILATADFHGNLPEIEPCDLLLIAGDICPDFPDKSSKYSFPDTGGDQQAEWLDTTFRHWLDRVPAYEVVAIAGNHDFIFERDDVIEELELPWTYLKDSACEAEGLKIWGTPWVPALPRWAFYGTPSALKARADLIPADTDILMSHGPPYGYADFTVPQYGSMHVGEDALNIAIWENKPRVVVCGHIHEGYGRVLHASGIPIYNVARMDENYRRARPPIELGF